MDRRIKICYCEIVTDSNYKISATKLRSYIGYKFAQDTDFHQHDDKPFRYPLIQYKRINDKLYVIGFEKCADLVRDRLSGLQHISLKDKKIPVLNTSFLKTTHELNDTITKYKFISPWIALNKDNYTKFKSLDSTFYKKFLEKILIGNILGTMRGFDHTIDYDLYVKMDRFTHIPIIAHKSGFSGFYSSFVTNLSLPMHIGIGKSVSKGFGVLEQVDN